MRGHPDGCTYLENASILPLSLSRGKGLRERCHAPAWKIVIFLIGKTSRSWREICALCGRPFRSTWGHFEEMAPLFLCYLQNANWTLAEIEKIKMANLESTAWSFI